MPSIKRILVVCRQDTDSIPFTHPFDRFDDIETYVASSASDAILRLKEMAFNLMMVETNLDKTSGLGFLAEARKRLPNVQRVVLETTPIDIPLHSLVNDVAPAAIFPGAVDVERIRELLFPPDATRAAMAGSAQEADGDLNSEGMSESEKIDFVTEISVALNGMIEDPKVELPVLPEWGLRIQKTMKDQQSTFETIAELVEVEQGMSAKILQVANSPIYAGLERIRNLQQAVARLGTRETRNILMIVLAQHLFANAPKSSAELMRELWMHSLCTAYSNEIIAQKLQIAESDDYFTMGLLHDVGRLLVIALIEQGRQTGLWKGRTVTEDITRRVMNMRHNDLGARLMEKWFYPKAFQEVILLHDDDVGIHRRSEHVIVTYFSNVLTRKVGYSLVPYEGSPLANEELARVLNMSTEIMVDIESSVRKMTEKIEQSCLADEP